MKPSIIVLVLAAIGAAVLACADSTGGEPVLTATAIASGNGQSALVGTMLPQPLQVQVLSDDVALAGAAVTWEPSAGSVVITSNITDSNGIASARWILGNAPGELTLAASVSDVQGSPVLFTATALGWVTPAVDPATDNQSGIVRASLAQPLRVTAFAGGAPAEGVTVTWSTTDGTVTPPSSLTDRFGAATATWTLSETAGEVIAKATVGRTTGSPLTFHATARAGPLARLEKVQGDEQLSPWNFPSFDLLRVRATDRYGNAVVPPALVWSVESGPVELVEAWGGGVARVRPTRELGDAVVRAAVQGSAVLADFHLSVGPPVPLALLDLTSPGFVSLVNGSTPAVDTIAAGERMTWVLSWSGYDDHAIASDGGAPFWGPLHFFWYDDPAIVDWVFTEPGTYHYKDYFDPAITGTLVVR